MTPAPTPTLPPLETDPEIDAYNAAFDELGLNWHWDRSVMRQLAAIPIESARITAYVQRHQPHLLTVYPADFLASVISETKARLSAPKPLPIGR
jgi:hypothetical protein